MVTQQEAIVLLSIPVSAIILAALQDDAPADVETVSTVVYNVGSSGKEKDFLRFNQDGIYSNLLAAEEHYRKILKQPDMYFNQCAVKHLSLSGNHSDEAISHSIAIGDTKDSKKYAELSNNIVQLQHDVQDGKVTPEKGIERIRELKHEFESFNPSFDVSKCKACEI